MIAWPQAGHTRARAFHWIPVFSLRSFVPRSIGVSVGSSWNSVRQCAHFIVCSLCRDSLKGAIVPHSITSAWVIEPAPPTSPGRPEEGGSGDEPRCGAQAQGELLGPLAYVERWARGI